jgi:hypothetical protein
MQALLLMIEILPSNGVYASFVDWRKGRFSKGALHLPNVSTRALVDTETEWARFPGLDLEGFTYGRISNDERIDVGRTADPSATLGGQFGGMAASGSVCWSRPFAKML